MPMQKATCLDYQIANDPTLIVNEEIDYTPNVAIGSTYFVMLEILQATQHRNFFTNTRVDQLDRMYTLSTIGAKGTNQDCRRLIPSFALCRIGTETPLTVAHQRCIVGLPCVTSA
jgi:hypothetical protein